MITVKGAAATTAAPFSSPSPVSKQNTAAKAAASDHSHNAHAPGPASFRHMSGRYPSGSDVRPR